MPYTPVLKTKYPSLVATLGVVAGLAQEQREAVINRPSLSNAHFIQVQLMVPGITSSRKQHTVLSSLLIQSFQLPSP